jgi:hypothetical protein
VAASGASFVLAVIPCAEQTHDDLWQELVTQAGERKLDRERPERELVRIADQESIPVVTLADPFRRASTEVFLNHRHHLNDAGHALVAEALYRAIGNAGAEARSQ